MRRLLAPLSLAALLTVSACASDATPPTQPTTTAQAPTATQAPTEGQPATDGAAAAFLAEHGLDGLSVTQIIDRLDATNDDRETGPVGSVRPTELLLADDEAEISLPIEGDFYLSIAPYVTGTHECYNHNLASCQGELADTGIDVTITAEDGTVLHDGEVTTAPNGFAGFWLPRDITATVTIGHDGRTSVMQVSTGADDPTCLTTMRLS